MSSDNASSPSGYGARVTAGWGSALTGVVPFGLVIAISPVTVIPAVLVLHTPRPRLTGLAFLTGWMVGVAGLTAIFVAASGPLGGLHRTPPPWASWLRIAIGSALIAFGVYRWLTRHRHSDMPRWMRSFTGMTPRGAAATAVVLAAIRPEVFLMCAVSGLAISSAGLDPAGVWAAAAFFVAVAVSSVAIPILGFVAAGGRVDAALTRFKEWMEKQHAALLAAVLVLIGVMVAYNGLRGR